MKCIIAYFIFITSIGSVFIKCVTEKTMRGRQATVQPITILNMRNVHSLLRSTQSSVSVVRVTLMGLCAAFTLTRFKPHFSAILQPQIYCEDRDGTVLTAIKTLTFRDLSLLVDQSINQSVSHEFSEWRKYVKHC